MGRIDLVTLITRMDLRGVGNSILSHGQLGDAKTCKEAGEDGTGALKTSSLGRCPMWIFPQSLQTYDCHAERVSNQLRIITVSDSILEELVNLKRRGSPTAWMALGRSDAPGMDFNQALAIRNRIRHQTGPDDGTQEDDIMINAKTKRGSLCAELAV